MLLYLFFRGVHRIGEKNYLFNSNFVLEYKDYIDYMVRGLGYEIYDSTDKHEPIFNYDDKIEELFNNQSNYNNT